MQIVDLPPPHPPFDLLGPQEIRQFAQPPAPPPFDVLGPHPPAATFPYNYPPRPPFNLLGPQEPPAGVRTFLYNDLPRPPPFALLGPQAMIGPFARPPAAEIRTAFNSGARFGLAERNGVWLPTPGENPSEVYKAALTGDWETAERLFQQDRHRTQAVISSRWILWSVH